VRQAAERPAARHAARLHRAVKPRPPSASAAAGVRPPDPHRSGRVSAYRRARGASGGEEQWLECRRQAPTILPRVDAQDGSAASRRHPRIIRHAERMVPGAAAVAVTPAGRRRHAAWRRVTRGCVTPTAS